MGAGGGGGGGKHVRELIKKRGGKTGLRRTKECGHVR